MKKAFFYCLFLFLVWLSIAATTAQTLTPQAPIDTALVWWPSPPMQLPIYKTTNDPVIQVGNTNTVLIEVKKNTKYKIIEVIPQFDTTWQVTEAVEFNSPKIAYSSGWSDGANQTKFFNGDFKYLNTAVAGERVAVLTYTSTDYTTTALWSERFSGHGVYTIQADNGPVATINAGVAPFVSDKDRVPATSSWTSQVLPPGTHTITIKCSTQMVIDRLTISKRVITPK